MKSVHLYLILAVIAGFASCSHSDLNESESDTFSNNVRLTLTCTCEATRAVWTDPEGSGSLSFSWEYVDIDSDNVENHKFVLSDGITPLASWDSELYDSEQEFMSYSGLSVTPGEDDPNIATFQTSRYYSQADVSAAKYCFAITGSSEIAIVR